ncbi:MAG TPA: heavy metal-binding domain-containing protein [Ignavibacteria bacterium]|nr:heavy metal-binding domain-containing protein [Ignavibacteria bacterium]
MDSKFITTTPDFHGYKITRYLGMACGYGNGWGKFGTSSYDEAFHQMINYAEQLGANAIVGLKVTIDNPGLTSQFFVYGTAVIVEAL